MRAALRAPPPQSFARPRAISGAEKGGRPWARRVGRGPLVNVRPAARPRCRRGDRNGPGANQRAGGRPAGPGRRHACGSPMTAGFDDPRRPGRVIHAGYYWARPSRGSHFECGDIWARFWGADGRRSGGRGSSGTTTDKSRVSSRRTDRTASQLLNFVVCGFEWCPEACSRQDHSYLLG